MFNDFNLTNKEISKIINDYDPLIRKKSTKDNKFDEDISQEIKLLIFKKLSKNRNRKV